MTAFPSDLNSQAINIKPYVLIDQISAFEFYIGTSQSFSNPTANNWRIQKIVQVGTVWNTTLYPDGDQGFNFKWSDRLIYSYK